MKLAILDELASVLNIQLSSLRSWSWPESGVPLEPRYHLNGKSHFFLDSEILTCLLLHFIGLERGKEFRSAIAELRESLSWKKGPYILVREENARRDAFLGPESTSSALQRPRKKYQTDNYFMYQLPRVMETVANYYSDEAACLPHYVLRNDGPKFGNPVNLKQSLLHMLSADVTINKFRFGKCADGSGTVWSIPPFRYHRHGFAALRHARA